MVEFIFYVLCILFDSVFCVLKSGSVRMECHDLGSLLVSGFWSENVGDFKGFCCF